jgi:hypothetical protein
LKSLALVVPFKLKMKSGMVFGSTERMAVPAAQASVALFILSFNTASLDIPATAVGEPPDDIPVPAICKPTDLP